MFLLKITWAKVYNNKKTFRTVKKLVKCRQDEAKGRKCNEKVKATKA